MGVAQCFIGTPWMEMQQSTRDARLFIMSQSVMHPALGVFL
jgi:hypothetical protein